MGMASLQNTVPILQGYGTIRAGLAMLYVYSAITLAWELTRLIILFRFFLLWVWQGSRIQLPNLG